MVLLFFRSFFLFISFCFSQDEQFKAPVWNREIETGALQSKIDQLTPHSYLRLSPEVHEGPIIIRTPGVIIDGFHGAIVSGQQKGSVIVIEADNVEIRNLKITASGRRYEQADAGISIRKAKNVKIISNQIDDSLFGIDVHAGEDVLIKDNRIRSLNLDVGLRGDAIRFWSSQKSSVEKNVWENSRDAVAWYSENIVFDGNSGSGSRYSLHSMYSKKIKIMNNIFKNNSVGIFLMYGQDISVFNNVISYSQGATGMGIGLKETSNVSIMKNKFHYCAIGMLVDNSPFIRGSRNWIQNNVIAFNGKGIVLNNDFNGNSFKDNSFLGNIVDVDTEHRKGSQSEWKGNKWYKYLGFDRNNDGIGDFEHMIKKYGDRIKSKSLDSSFFYLTPLFSIIEYIEELLYLGKPQVILIDKAPRIIKKIEDYAD